MVHNTMRQTLRLPQLCSGAQVFDSENYYRAGRHCWMGCNQRSFSQRTSGEDGALYE